MGRWTVAPCLALLVGCTSDPVTLEVPTWWRETSEAIAFDAVRDELKGENIEVPANDFWSATRSRAHLNPILLMGRPPSSFQANLGADLLRWSAVDLRRLEGEPYRENYIVELDELFTDTGLYQQLDGYLLKGLTLNGEEPYAMPLNIHRLNLLYYDPESIDGSDLDIDFLCPMNPEEGRPGVPIAIGVDDGFSLIQLVFEAILPGRYGADFYDRFFVQDEEPAGWVESMRHVLLCLQYLSRDFIANENGSPMQWADAVEAVATKRAYFTVTGDWATGALAANRYPHSVSSMVFPGTGDAFIYTSDTFPMTKGGAHPDETRSLLRAMADREVQVRFSRAKGSMPARADARRDPAFAGPTRDDYESEIVKKLPATSGLFPPYYPISDLDTALRNIASPPANDPDSIEEALNLIRSARPLIARWRRDLENEPGNLGAP